MPRNPKIVSKTMRAVKSADTKPEMKLRRGLFARGLRYRVHRKSLPGKPDIVFGPAMVAVFVDGDFWHGGQWKRRGFKSLGAQLQKVNNKKYWIEKIKRNMARDTQNNEKLKKAGYKVIRVWESDINKRLGWAVDKVARQVQARRARALK
ncbi:MAG TPA: very short patch repair endonuclease [Nitrospirae bacterium]|nr:very short patch repair endonuclease [Nitrospirota bacterium]